MRDVTPPPRMAIQAERVGIGVPGTEVGDAKGVLNPSTSTAGFFDLFAFFPVCLPKTWGTECKIWDAIWDPWGRFYGLGRLVNKVCHLAGKVAIFLSPVGQAPKNDKNFGKR